MRHASALAAFSAAFLGAACASSEPTSPADTGQAAVTVNADLTAVASVGTVVIEITAPDLSDPLVFNLPVENGVASGTITIPAGSDRTITLRVFDTNGIETHNGSVTVDIETGVNLSLSIVVEVATADVDIEITLQVLNVTVEPASATITVDETITLSATVTDQDGNEIAGPALWASADLSVASVDQNGVVTGVGEGVAQIVAMFAGVAGSATVTVTP